ncbi:MAG: hypothetical protein AAFU57_08150 [Bacteroidota bacterium]
MKKNYIFYCLLVLFISSAQAQEVPEFFFEKVESYIYSPNHEKKMSKEFFKELKGLSEAGNSKAYYYLGLYQKEGIGTKPNLKKSLKSFKKAYELGDTISAYCVGYYYLKGFGEIQQDYSKAYRWFKKSSIPMATHWMAKMNYLGLGREQNKKRAIKMLKDNELYNSKVLVTQYEEGQNSDNPKSDYAEFLTLNSYSHSSFNDMPEISALNGRWTGEYLELDWSETKPLRVISIACCGTIRNLDRGIESTVYPIIFGNF